MAPRTAPTVPVPTPDQRRVAAENAERAKQVAASGNYDYAISLYTLCCKIDAASLPYRKALRKAQKSKYNDNLRGSRFAFLTTPRLKAKVKAAKASRDYLRVLEAAEAVLAKNPWDSGVQTDQAEAFDALGLTDMAIFTLDQARQKYPKDATLNRALARLFEKRGDYRQAITLWQMVKNADPRDVEAAHKAKDLAASETIAKGGYEEAAAGTKESPIIGRMEAAGSASHDKLGKDVNAVLKRIEADPGEPSLYVQLAAAYRKHNQPDRARAALQQGLAPTGNHSSLEVELAELDIDTLRKSVAVADAKLKAAQANPDADLDPDAPTVDELTRAKSKLQADLIDREIAVLRGRSDRAPTDAGRRLELGAKLVKADRLDDAIAELQIAKRDDKHKGRAAMYLGACFRKRNNWRLAQRNFEDALATLPETDEAGKKEVLFQLATGSAEAGELQRALDLGHELANLDYGYKNIGRLIDDWQAKLQKAG